MKIFRQNTHRAAIILAAATVAMALAGCAGSIWLGHAWNTFVGIEYNRPIYVSNEEDLKRGDFCIGTSPNWMFCVHLREVGDVLEVKTTDGVLVFRQPLAELIDPATGAPIGHVPSNRTRAVKAARLALAETLGQVDQLADLFQKPRKPYPENEWGDIRFSLPTDGEPFQYGYSFVFMYRKDHPIAQIALKALPDGDLKWAGTEGYRGNEWGAWRESQALALARAHFPEGSVPAGAAMEAIRPAPATRVEGRRSGELRYLWRLKGKPAPYYVGQDGITYRLKRGLVFDAATDTTFAFGPMVLTPVATRATDIRFSDEMPSGAEMNARVSRLPILADMAGVYRQRWGQPAKALLENRQHWQGERVSSRFAYDGLETLLGPIKTVASQAGANLRVAEGDGEFVLLREGRLVGYVRNLGVSDFLACRTLFARNLSDKPKGALPLGIEASPSWQVAGTTVALLSVDTGARNGLMLFQTSALATGSQ